jgi:RHS repeat-associated protein
LDGEGYSNRLYTSQIAQNRNYVGQLYDYGARFLNVRTGRFVSPDNFGKDGLDRFRYAANNPLKNNDPSGHFINVTAGVIGVAIGFGIGAALAAGPKIIENYQKGARDLDALTAGIDPVQVAKAAVVGAVAGGAIGLTFGAATGVAATIGQEALSGAGFNTAGYLLASSTINRTADNNASTGFVDGAIAFGSGAVSGAISAFAPMASQNLWLKGAKHFGLAEKAINAGGSMLGNLLQYGGTQMAHGDSLSGEGIASSAVSGIAGGLVGGSFSTGPSNEMVKRAGGWGKFQFEPVRKLLTEKSAEAWWQWGASSIARGFAGSAITSLTPENPITCGYECK